MTNSKNHSISPQLIKAYRNTVYEVHSQGQDIHLYIGKVNRELVALMKQKGVTTAAFLTAFNPFSKQLSIEENQSAQEKLLSDLDKLSISIVRGQGKDETGLWPPEPSVLALGISLQEAENLADRYSQNAFVWVGNLDGFVSLRLRYPIEIPSQEELYQWISHLPVHLQESAKSLTHTELAWLMSVPNEEVEHWLSPHLWDLNQPWPIAKPDGSAMGVGTELDRVFRLIHAGVQSLI